MSCGKWLRELGLYSPNEIPGGPHHSTSAWKEVVVGWGPLSSAVATENGAEEMALSWDGGCSGSRAMEQAAQGGGGGTIPGGV